MASVVIVEDHTLVADMLAAALAARGVQAVAVPCDGPDLFDRIVELSPQLVLLDLDLGSAGDGSALIAPLVERGVRVLVVTGSADRLRIAAAVEQGAIGCQTQGRRLRCTAGCDLSRARGPPGARRGRTLAPAV